MKSKFNKKTPLHTKIDKLYNTYSANVIPRKFKKREWIHETPIPMFHEVLTKIQLDNAANALNKAREAVVEPIIEP